MKRRYKISKHIVKSFIEAIEKVDSDTLIYETIKFSYDLNKYGYGVLLWLKYEYSNFISICTPFLGNLISDRTSKFQPEMKKIADDYYKFIKKVKERNLLYYQEEFDRSRLTLSKQPLYILSNQDLYIRKFHQRLSNILNNYSCQLKEYNARIIPILKKFTEKMMEEIEKNKIDDISKENIELNLDKNEDINDLFRDLKKMTKVKFVIKIIKNARTTSKAIIRTQKKTLALLPEVSEKFKNLIEELKEDVDEISWIKLRLSQIMRLDAYYIYFIKYIARLNHILSRNSIDYHPIYIRLTHEHSEPRREMEPILNDMQEDFPYLSYYLNELLYYFKLVRNEEAHKPVPIVRKHDGAFWVVDPKTQEETEFKVEEFEREITSFAYLIDALRLPKGRKFL